MEVVAQQRVQEDRLAGGVVVEARRAVVREEARAELAQLPRALVRPARVEVNLLGDRVERPPVVGRQPVERERRAADGGLERAAVELEEQHEQRVVELRLGRDRRRALLLLGALLRRRRRARRQRRERREQRLAQRVRRREERRRRLLDDGRCLRRVRLRRLPHHRQRAQRLRDEAALARADPPVDVGEGGGQRLLRVDRRRRRLRRRGRRVHGHRLRHCRVGAVRRSRSVPILRRGSVRELRRPRSLGMPAQDSYWPAVTGSRSRGVKSSNKLELNSYALEPPPFNPCSAFSRPTCAAQYDSSSAPTSEHRGSCVRRSSRHHPSGGSA